MARYGRERKEATRRRIIETAGRRLKKDGIDGSGVATLMADAGLTNGAFYAHFASKEDLVATVVADQLHHQAATFRAQEPGRAGLEEFARQYLSHRHRDHPELGCPSAALLDEIARCTKATKRAYSAGVQDIVDEVATRLSPDQPQAARGTALNLITMMIGTLQLSRALADRRLSDEVLEEGLRKALDMLGSGESTA